MGWRVGGFRDIGAGTEILVEGATIPNERHWEVHPSRYVLQSWKLVSKLVNCSTLTQYLLKGEHSNDGEN